MGHNIHPPTTQLMSAFGQTQEQDSTWNLLARQYDTKVSMSLDKVGDRVLHDLAEEVAHYLVLHEGMSEDYVLAMVDTPSGGREVRAFWRADLTADLEGKKKARMEEYLIENPLIAVDDPSSLPSQPQDEKLLGLAEVGQKFVNQNEKLLNILARDGHLPW
jgi:hypothetical protein